MLCYQLHRQLLLLSYAITPESDTWHHVAFVDRLFTTTYWSRALWGAKNLKLLGIERPLIFLRWSIMSFHVGCRSKLMPLKIIGWVLSCVLAFLLNDSATLASSAMNYESSSVRNSSTCRILSHSRLLFGPDRSIIHGSTVVLTIPSGIM